MKKGQTGKPSVFRSLSKLLAYAGRVRSGFLLVLFFALVSTVCAVIGPKLMGNAINMLVEGISRKINGNGGIDFTAVGKTLLILAAFYGVNCLLTFVQDFMVAGMAQKICFSIRKDLSEKMDRMPVGYFESRQTGDVLSIITNDVDILSTGLNTSVVRIVTPVLSIVGILIMMLTISPLLTGISILILPASLLLLMLLMNLSQKHYAAQQNVLGEINGQIEETFSGQRVIRLFGKEEDSTEEFLDKNDRLYDALWKSQFMAATMVPVMNLVGNIGYVAVAVLSCSMVVSGRLTLGDVQAFIQYVKNFTLPEVCRT